MSNVKMRPYRRLPIRPYRRLPNVKIRLYQTPILEELNRGRFVRREGKAGRFAYGKG